MTNGKEMTVREATIFSLEQSQNGFETLQTTFKETSGLFDEGKDADGLQKIAQDIIPPLKTLFEFCTALLGIFEDVPDEETKEELAREYIALEDLMNLLIDETEKGNMTEVGDILRFDFMDLVSNMSNTFPKLIKCFEESKDKTLDEY